ncbi:hypothetical protein LCGC14_2762860 [marine sediment metagenome]|uniref:Uncharacterized protein n=1 Tax=marine sediment metagenome TaxID=412755 RepID=A0A0F8ZKC9_9ZZZZ
MDPINVAQLGVAGVAVIVLLLVVKEFLKFARKQEDGFTGIIKNHLRHSTKATNKLDKTIQELIIFLKKNNNK